MLTIEFLSRQLTSARDGQGDAAVLDVLTAVFAQAERGDAQAAGVARAAMFEWKMLAERYAPARQAWAALREQWALRACAGDDAFGGASHGWPPSRFQLIASMNELLDDEAATYAVFVRLEAAQPALAPRVAGVALPALLQAGDFTRAARYQGNPLDQLDRINAYAQTLPLFPPPGAAPRLAAELHNFMGEVFQFAAIRQGLGQPEQAAQVLGAALEGLATDEMRALARRELDDPGAIFRALAEHRTAQDAAGA